MKLAASLLDADFARLGAEVGALCEAGIRRVHIDVMDGHFVPNLGFGPQALRALRPVANRCDAQFNAHLMVQHPERFVGMFADAGAYAITVHVESASPLEPLLAELRRTGRKAGVALNPSTDIAPIAHLLDEIDECLVMTVEPGFGGQELIPAALDKVRQLARLRAGQKPVITVDGGVNAGTIADVLRAGADIAVAGSALFSPPGSVADNVAQLNAVIASASKGDRQ